VTTLTNTQFRIRALQTNVSIFVIFMRRSCLAGKDSRVTNVREGIPARARLTNVREGLPHEPRLSVVNRPLFVDRSVVR
jgi:hypothetical protein